MLDRKLQAAGPMTMEERKVATIMVVTVVSWIWFGELIGLANIALLSSVLLFVFRTIKWKDVESYVNWGVILMYGGAISLGSALVETNAASWFANLVMSNITLSPILFLVLVSFVAIFLTEGISNAACVSILLPIMFQVGDIYAINPIATVFVVAVPSGLAFILPMGTPPNAIAYSSGYYEIRDVFVPALILNVVSWIFFIVMALLYWPMIGLNLT
jgi:sodium-dependent dicarboxylate transporter 2/3/5